MHHESVREGEQPGYWEGVEWGAKKEDAKPSANGSNDAPVGTPSEQPGGSTPTGAVTFRLKVVYGAYRAVPISSEEMSLSALVAAMNAMNPRTPGA
jgi:hypothetical protein